MNLRYYFTALDQPDRYIYLIIDEQYWSYEWIPTITPIYIFAGNFTEEIKFNSFQFYYIEFTVIPSKEYYDKIMCCISMLKLKGNGDNIYLQKN